MNQVLLLVVAAAFSACATSTNIVGIWKNPEVSKIAFERVVVAFQDTDQSLRRGMEDAMVANIRNASASYTMLPAGADEARARVVFNERGFDGAVVARLVAVGARTTYAPGQVWWGTAPYLTMWGYWGYGWQVVAEPAYMTRESVVTLETNVYSVADESLVWASRSETFDPQSGAELVRSVVSATAARMRKEGVLP